MGYIIALSSGAFLPTWTHAGYRKGMALERNEAVNPANFTGYTVDGLREPSEILVDSWGVAHIYAGSLHDAFFAQGFNAARDRLWQIDLWRRRGLGLLSEVFGPSFVERDQAARLFLYRGDMRREWSAYGPDTESIMKAFVGGINEYVRLTAREPDLLPPEFATMGYLPAFWSAEDVARIRSHGLYHNVKSEVERALALRAFGTRAEALRSPLAPPHRVIVPEGLDLSLIPDEVLGVYELATSPVDFAGEATKGNAAEGSNNWAVSPERTATGRPILAGDPHRALSVPSLRYAVHLCAPGLDLIGASEPALPGIATGHNGKIAFSFTIFPVDQEDLYVYETNARNPSEYRYEGRWEPMKVEEQWIRVKDGEPVRTELKFTRHGPVVYEDPEKRAAFAVRAAWLEAGTAPYLGSIGYARAKDWNEFLAATGRSGSPGLNLVYADEEGNIGWKPAALVPRRPNWDGLLPVPGDGRYEWDGFLGTNELPVELNPARGWIATANQMNLPEGYPNEEKKVSFEWYAPFRYQRIAEVLENDTTHTLRGSVALQTDYLSIPARRIVAQLRGLRSEDPEIEAALEMLRGWHCVLSTDSAPAALFEVWTRRYLRRALLSAAVAPEARDALLAAAETSEEQTGDARSLVHLVENPRSWFAGTHPEEARDAAVLESLKNAIQHLERLLGPDREAWAWGRLHHAFLAHQLSPLADDDALRALNVGPLPRPGSGDTVGHAAYRTEDFRQTVGSLWRMAVDVGAWDGTLAMNSPGQSGDPRSPHYADLFPEWAKGKAFPLLFSRPKIEATIETRIALEPNGD